ncbi:MAG: RecX family transcriptional regulator [Alphaproteobacteria bacterium]|nr:RecX family transcriptional regulator [Alphaproteobacteria bacterium]
MPRHQPRKIKVPTEPYLHNVALFYLERFSATAEMLRRVLTRRVERAARAGVIDEAGKSNALETVNRLVAQAVTAGLVNDALYAEARAVSLLRRGKSPTWMMQDLAERGIAQESRTAAIDKLAETYGDHQNLTVEAALTLARKRRIGPYRLPDESPLEPEEQNRRRLREMGIMARAGFDYQTAAEVISRPGRR